LARPSDFIVLATIVMGAVAASVIDMRTRRVPNELNLMLAAMGLVLAASGMSGLTLVAALAGCGVGLAMMLPGFLLGATGAGDVKLFAAMGTLVGPTHMVRAFVFTALAGGIMAVAIAVHRGRLRQTIGSTATLVTSGGANAAVIESPIRHNRFPYAPAIAVGILIAALGR
jgi:prepilin peptidase CpaA